MANRGPNDLIFRCDGILYDASRLIQVDSPDRCAIATYLTLDKRRGFKVSLDEVGNYSVTVLSTLELHQALQGNYSSKWLPIEFGRTATKDEPLILQSLQSDAEAER